MGLFLLLWSYGQVLTGLDGYFAGLFAGKALELCGSLCFLPASCMAGCAFFWSCAGSAWVPTFCLGQVSLVGIKVAIVHYWLTGMGGGENVVEALCRIWPGADIYTHALRRDALSPSLASREIRTSFVNKLPLAHRWYKKYLPLMPLALEQLDLRSYDLVISSESGPAKGVLTRSDAAHVCYCHSPMRYLWDFYQDYLDKAGLLTRLVMRLAFHYLRQWDVLAANRVDAFAANSLAVAARIRKHWRRQATVIHPPVAVEAVADAGRGEDAESAIRALRARYGRFLLCAGRLVAYKRTDLAIRAIVRYNAGLENHGQDSGTGPGQLSLVLAGDGEERHGLEKLARELGAPVHFLGRCQTGELCRLYHACAALLFPGEEDFGIVPVEAMAAGKPVIAYGRGGVCDSVLPEETGVFFASQDADAVADAIRLTLARSFDPDRIRARAAGFAESVFAEKISALAEKTLTEVRAGRLSGNGSHSTSCAWAV